MTPEQSQFDNRCECSSPSRPIRRSGDKGHAFWVPAIFVAIATVVCLGLIVFISLAFGGKDQGCSVSETTRAVVSPDGSWSLIVKVRDEGALGGSSHVILRPTEGGDEEDDTIVYSGGWNPDLSAHWIDARTIAVDGEWQMPFVENSINTDSIRTSGTTIDALGYVHNLLPRGERVVMLNGLSFVMSRGFFGELLTRFESGEGRPWQEFKRAGASSSPGFCPYRLLAMDVPSEATLWETARGGELLGNSNDGTIEVRWVREAGWLVVITRMPGRLMGLLVASDVSFDTSGEARQGAELIWTELGIGGLSLPWATD